MRVREIMTSPVQTVPVGSSLREAAQMMRARRMRHLVLVDAAGHVAGVLSDRDVRASQPSMHLMKDEEMRIKMLSLSRVEDAASTGTYTVREEDSVAKALRIMRDQKIGCLPVVHADGTPVGVITGIDVLDLALSLLT